MNIRLRRIIIDKRSHKTTQLNENDSACLPDRLIRYIPIFEMCSRPVYTLCKYLEYYFMRSNLNMTDAVKYEYSFNATVIQ